MFMDDCENICLKTCQLKGTEYICPGNFTMTTVIYSVVGVLFAICLPILIFNIYCFIQTKRGLVRLYSNRFIFKFVTMDVIKKLNAVETAPLIKQSQQKQHQHKKRAREISSSSSSEQSELLQEAAVKKEHIQQSKSGEIVKLQNLSALKIVSQKQKPESKYAFKKVDSSKEPLLE